jgi:hypothetical protein
MTTGFTVFCKSNGRGREADLAEAAARPAAAPVSEFTTAEFFPSLFLTSCLGRIISDKDLDLPLNRGLISASIFCRPRRWLDAPSTSS